MSTLAPATKADPRWDAVLARSPEADGRFVYAVRTTGIFCRPSCPARRARPENVSFHATCEDAAAAGFRPCLRCRPDEVSAPRPHAGLVADACRRIERACGPIPLASLARQSGLSAFHFHRVFKEATGLTPRLYAAGCRAARVRDRLAAGTGTVTDALYAAGYTASSRFYEASGAALGMSPSAFRRGGERTEIAYAVGTTSLGRVLVARTNKGVCAVLLGDDPDDLARDLERRFPRAAITRAPDGFEDLVATVARLVDAPTTGHDLPLDLRGTAFQQRVWAALRDIPAGTTATYGAVAAALGQPSAVRAVARACAANPVAVAVPCHRVVRGDGSPAGYRWGTERKRRLLGAEQAVVPAAGSTPTNAR